MSFCFSLFYFKWGFHAIIINIFRQKKKKQRNSEGKIGEEMVLMFLAAVSVKYLLIKCVQLLPYVLRVQTLARSVGVVWLVL